MTKIFNLIVEVFLRKRYHRRGLVVMGQTHVLEVVGSNPQLDEHFSHKFVVQIKLFI